MSDAFDYFRAYAVRALCKARSMPRGRMKHLQLVAGRINNLLKKEAAYTPNTQHLEDLDPALRKVETVTFALAAFIAWLRILNWFITRACRG
jgi:hypothetical protein